MSQVARIKRISFRGAPAYIGEDHGNPLYSGNPEKVANWLCDGFRTRFNQLRSNRCKYVYENGEQLFIEDGNPLLTPIGDTVVDVTHKQAREVFHTWRVSQGTQTGDGDTASFRWEVYDDSFNVLARGTVAGDKGMVTAQRAAEAAARGLFH